ncbi:hypothetical protein GOODEAATRI_025389 [Goodea atripinnis]|uniref:Uncharacterized protein n=1 Tax=Goodea atripinnis TaxID=208336 RepID=A0ABV0NXM4_9TELE
MGRTSKLHADPRAGSKPRACLLQDNSASNCAPMEPSDPFNVVNEMIPMASHISPSSNVHTLPRPLKQQEPEPFPHCSYKKIRGLFGHHHQPVLHCFGVECFG